MKDWLRVLLGSLFWILLGGWIGAYALFGLVIAPTAFRELPTDLAGMLASRSLVVLHLGGAVAGVVLAGLSWAFGRGRLLVGVPLVFAALLLYSHFGITGAMSEIHAQAVGPDADPALQQQYFRLHGRSMAIFVGIGFGLLALVPFHVRRESVG